MRVHACKHIHWFVFRSLCFVFCAFQTKNKNIAFNHFTCFSMFYFVEEWDQNDFTSCCCCVVCSKTTIFLFLKFPSVLRCVYKYINPNFINTNTSYHSANARIKYLLVGTCEYECMIIMYIFDDVEQCRKTKAKKNFNSARRKQMSIFICAVNPIASIFFQPKDNKNKGPSTSTLLNLNNENSAC